MKRRPLARIAIAIAPEAEEAVGELLENLFGQPAVVHTDVASGKTTATIYLAGPSPVPPEQRQQLIAGLRRLRAAGLGLGSGRVSVSALPPENWAESWKRHFQPLEISPALLLKPSWSRRRPRRGQAVVVLDPGLSFGTGQHATTRFCLQQLAGRRRPGLPQSFLDVGTGSGILALAAARLGYAPVRALDFDPDAVRVARANARHNGLARSVRIDRADLTRLPMRSRRRYDVVCANLLSTLLIAERDRLLNRVAADGVLVVAGILKREFAAVQRVFEEAGLRCVARRSEREWRSGAFGFARPGRRPGRH